MSDEKKPQQNPPEAEAPKQAQPQKSAEPVKEPEIAPVPPQTTAEAKPKETAPVEPAGTVAAVPPATKEKAPAEKITPTNCVQCNKSIRKIRWYYRDGKFYCTKRCWMTAMEKAEKKSAEGQVPEAK